MSFQKIHFLCNENLLVQHLPIKISSRSLEILLIKEFESTKLLNIPSPCPKISPGSSSPGRAAKTKETVNVLQTQLKHSEASWMTLAAVCTLTITSISPSRYYKTFSQISRTSALLQLFRHMVSLKNEKYITACKWNKYF